MKEEHLRIHFENAERDVSQIYFEAIKNVDATSEKKNKEKKRGFGVGSTSQIYYPSGGSIISSQYSNAQPEYGSILDSKMTEFEARQKQAFDQLCEDFAKVSTM